MNWRQKLIELGQKCRQKLIDFSDSGDKYGERWNNYLFELMISLFSFILLCFVIILSFFGWTVVWPLYLILIVGIITFGFREVRNPERWVIELFGYPVAIWAPGPHVLIPGLFKVRAIIAYKKLYEYQLFTDKNKTSYPDIVTVPGVNKEVTWQLGDIDFRDESVACRFVIFVQALSPYKLTYEVDKPLQTLVGRVESAARAVLSPLKLDDALAIKADAAKLILSYFLVKQEEWERVREKPVYDSNGKMVVGEDNRFVAVRSLSRVPFDFEPLEEDCHRYDLYDYGLGFCQEGIVLRDIEIPLETKELRRAVLKSQREVQVAEFNRQIRSLQGKGEADGIQHLVNLGISQHEAASYVAAIKLMDSGTLRDKTLLLAPDGGGLNFARLAALMGVTGSEAIKQVNQDKTGGDKQ